jgi:hypothetical protein
MKPTPEAIAEAKRNPGGSVYAIDEPYTSYDSAPTEAIVGAWQVDARGDISGAFIPNPYYRRPGPCFRFVG